MKPTAVDPRATTRAAAFDLWMDAPNPMVTFFKTLDVTPLVRLSRRRGYPFNLLLCWCIGRAASESKSFICSLWDMSCCDMTASRSIPS